MWQHCLRTYLMKLTISNCSNKNAQPCFRSVSGIARYHVFAETTVIFFGRGFGCVIFLGSLVLLCIMWSDENDPTLRKWKLCKWVEKTDASDPSFFKPKKYVDWNGMYICEKKIMVQYMYFRICIRSKISTHVWNRWSWLNQVAFRWIAVNCGDTRAGSFDEHGPKDKTLVRFYDVGSWHDLCLKLIGPHNLFQNTDWFETPSPSKFWLCVHQIVWSCRGAQ